MVPYLQRYAFTPTPATVEDNIFFGIGIAALGAHFSSPPVTACSPSLARTLQLGNNHAKCHNDPYPYNSQIIATK